MGRTIPLPPICAGLACYVTALLSTAGGRSSIRNLRTRHAVVTGTLLSPETRIKGINRQGSEGDHLRPSAAEAMNS